jgi:hypothetical protein
MLPVLSQTGLPSTLLADLNAARTYAQQSLFEATRTAYESDWRAFKGWCAALVPGYFLHLPDAVTRRRRDPARPHRMTAELRRIESDAGNALLDDVIMRTAAKLIADPLAALRHPPEQRTLNKAQPFPQQPHRTERTGAAQDRNGLAFALLVGLAAPDGDPDALLAEFEIFDVQRDHLGLPERAGKAEHHHRAVRRPFNDTSGAASTRRFATTFDIAAFLACAVPSERRSPFMVVLTMTALVGSGSTPAR